MPAKISADLAAYLDAFPPATRKVLDKIRATVRKAVPDAEEMRSYGVGAFKRGGAYVLYYAGYAKHVAIYPVYVTDAGMGAELEPYTSGKATAKFPLDKPIPYDLIGRIVKAKVAEHQARLEQRAATSKGPAGKKARALLAKKGGKAEAAAKPVAKKAAVKSAPQQAAKKAASKKAAQKKAAAKSKPLKAFEEMPNLSWSLLEETAPQKRKAADKPATAKKKASKGKKR